MNNLDYYTRQKEFWNETEIKNLKTEYEISLLTISQIGDIHRRTPGSIGYRLKNLGIVENQTLSRGYLEYKNSDLYKQIVSSEKKPKTDNPKKLSKKSVVETPMSDLREIKLLLIEMRDLMRKMVIESKRSE